MTALTVLGASLAIGVVASRTPAPGPAPGLRELWPPRNLAIVLFGFAEGIAVVGVVVGLLAVDTGLVDQDVNRVLAIAPGIGGAILGIVIVFRTDGAPYRQLQIIAASFIAGLGVLAGIVALLSVVIDEIATEPRADWPFVIAGLIAGLAAFGIGWLGSEHISALASTETATMQAEISKQISRVVPLEAVAVLASAAAIVALFAGPT